LPVLTRGPIDATSGRERGVSVQPDLVASVPTIETVVPAGQQSVVWLGAPVDLTGHHLVGAARQVHLVNDRFRIDEVLAAIGGDEQDRIQFVIPAARTADFPAAMYQTAAELTPPGDTTPRQTNSMALVVAPRITNVPMSVTVDASGTAGFTVEFTPEYRPGQSVSLILGSTEVTPENTSAQTGSLDFAVPNAPLGNHLVRLRIDGIESPVVNRTTTPPTFFDHRIQIS
jgi:hypothetical protein